MDNPRELIHNSPGDNRLGGYMEHYIENETYNRLVQALVNVRPCLANSWSEEDGVKLALGEIGNVWPTTVSVIAESS